MQNYTTPNKHFSDDNQEYTTSIVRKFLVNQLPADIKNHPILLITEAFVQAGENEIKFRRTAVLDKFTTEPISEQYTSVQKQGYGRRRKEKVEEQSAEDYDVIVKNLCAGRILTKTRCFATIEGERLARIDIFEGNYKGLCFAKIPFDNKYQADNFVKPSWLGAEITGDKRYNGGEMAIKQQMPQMPPVRES